MPKDHSKKPPGEVRIIGGLWKRTPLQVTLAPGLRPTPNRVRETLFNWLGQDLTGWQCADVFAGTGALGLEAASRGAAQVWMFETHPQALLQLRRNVEKLKAQAVKPVQADGLSGLAGLPSHALDLIFLDPPFEASCHEHALELARLCIKPTGWVYLEAGEQWTASRLAQMGWQLHRHVHAGMAHAHLMHPIA